MSNPFTNNQTNESIFGNKNQDKKTTEKRQSPSSSSGLFQKSTGNFFPVEKNKDSQKDRVNFFSSNNTIFKTSEPKNSPAQLFDKVEPIKKSIFSPHDQQSAPACKNQVKSENQSVWTTQIPKKEKIFKKESINKDANNILKNEEGKKKQVDIQEQIQKDFKKREQYCEEKKKLITKKKTALSQLRNDIYKQLKKQKKTSFLSFKSSLEIVLENAIKKIKQNKQELELQKAGYCEQICAYERQSNLLPFYNKFELKKQPIPEPKLTEQQLLQELQKLKIILNNQSQMEEISVMRKKIFQNESEMDLIKKESEKEIAICEQLKEKLRKEKQSNLQFGNSRFRCEQQERELYLVNMRKQLTVEYEKLKEEHKKKKNNRGSSRVSTFSKIY